MERGSTLRGRAAEDAPPVAAPAAAAARPHHRGLRSRGPWLLAAVLLAAALLASSCGGSPSASGSPGASPVTLTVFAASSLSDAFTKLGADFTVAHPGVKVVFSFAGSQDLAAQIEQGAPADVFASADTTNMDAVSDLTGSPAVFARNQLEIVVAAGNPENVRELADLANAKLKVVLAAPEVPAGQYAQRALGKAGVTVSPVSLEESVKGVVTKVSLGEADAGIVYVTDVAAAKGKVDGVTIPAAFNVTASYPVATLDASDRQADAQAFVDLLLSVQGQQVLRSFGFLPPGS